MHLIDISFTVRLIVAGPSKSKELIDTINMLSLMSIGFWMSPFTEI